MRHGEDFRSLFSFCFVLSSLTSFLWRELSWFFIYSLLYLRSEYFSLSILLISSFNLSNCFLNFSLLFSYFISSHFKSLLLSFYVSSFIVSFCSFIFSLSPYIFSILSYSFQFFLCFSLSLTFFYLSLLLAHHFFLSIFSLRFLSLSPLSNNFPCISFDL